MKNRKKCHVSSLLFKPSGSKVWPLSMRYAFLALRTLSRLDLISSRGISCMSLALWSLERKCSETAVTSVHQCNLLLHENIPVSAEYWCKLIHFPESGGFIQDLLTPVLSTLGFHMLWKTKSDHLPFISNECWSKWREKRLGRRGTERKGRLFSWRK